MCLILFSINQHPTYPFVLLANRDEFYKRPTATAEWWQDEPGLVAGKDLKAEGTWLGMTRSGKFAAITNYRDPKNIKADAPSRGHLVSDYLKGKTSAEEYLDLLMEKGESYNGFNLLFGTTEKLLYYSNYAGQPDTLSSGLYGLSNALLDDKWPKVVQGKLALEELLGNERFNEEQAIQTLFNKQLAPDNALPETGVGLELERMLSPMYIESPEYGTRCSTIITVDKMQRVRFTEISYIPQNKFRTEFEIKR